MVELIVTMIIIGIMAIAVVPRMDLLRGFDEIGFRDQVKSALEYARKSAVAQRRNVHVTITNTIVAVNIASDIPEGADAANFDRFLTLPGTNINNITAPPGVTLTPAVIINFDPLGRPSTGAVITVSGAGTITVEAETGYVH
ncbi:hypothetical protein MASR1M60_03010 [Rhodocyclaceae bacterium]